MTDKERLRAIMGNIKNYDFKVNPVFKLEIEDALVLIKMYSEWQALRMAYEKEMERKHRYYEENKEKLNAKAKARYHAKKGAKNEV